ncbi:MULTISPECIES: acyl carrier protein [unclassified Streptomyces]|uniref:HrnS Peptidyl carrier protein phosphopantetheine attachment site Pfam00550 n=1 Tax=Streptomyces sp. CMB-0406 TaxID=1826667 RepID=A0A167RNP7_9ACTN|nr:acyl carrier protein [Streptomyces sp. NBC_01716]SAI82903.1 HrnS; Peptidyl carrier protein; phosphopantetheine attachment site; Pfam00550 [Streptomyces sp. CMB-0406]
MWDESFEQLLRKQIPLLEPNEELTAELSLRDFGLDSMGMVSLLSSLEDEYGVRFVDDALNTDNFATPGTLWKTLDAMR